MSHTPTNAGDPKESYLDGWRSLNTLLRQGQSWSGHEQNVALLNLGNGRFADVSALSGFDFADDGRALVRTDLDGDGDLDLFVTNRNGPRLRYLENANPTADDAVIVRLVGRGGNLDAIGARAVLRLREDDEQREAVVGVRAGEGYLAQSSSALHFGLGSARPVGLSVRWPNGATEEIAGLDAAGRYIVVQGSGRAEPDPVALRAPAVSTAEAEQPAPEVTVRRPIPLVAPVPMPGIELETDDGRSAELYTLLPEGGRRLPNKPLWIQLWASWCAPCVAELTEFAGARAELEQAGLAVLALGTDAEDERARARAILERLEWPHSRGFATPEAIDVLDLLQRVLLGTEERLPVPAGFLVDAEGRLVAFSRGRVRVADVVAATRLLDLAPAARRNAAAALPGRWSTPPPQTDVEALAKRFAARGFARTARELRLSTLQVVQRDSFEVVLGFARASLARGDLDGALEQFEFAVELAPGSAAAQAELGLAYLRGGRTQDAVRSLTRASELDPDDPRPLSWLGHVHLSQGELEQARAIVVRLRAVDETLAIALDRAVELASAKDSE